MCPVVGGLKKAVLGESKILSEGIRSAVGGPEAAWLPMSNVLIAWIRGDEEESSNLREYSADAILVGWWRGLSVSHM